MSWKPRVGDTWERKASIMKDHAQVERIGHGTKQPANVPLEGVVYVTLVRNYPGFLVRSRVRYDLFLDQYKFVSRPS